MGGFLGMSVVINYIELILKLFTYIAVINVSFKAVQALNIYINKNSRQ